ncbi:hypothetical protein F6B41_04175 [Microbacterium lushaniae]|nr:hypothetical protein F6B41_19420 [Microbacterium lushaniae]KAA9158191.1 hypothetical protein F6B41_04175 [Microbacterium lushaniae]
MSPSLAREEDARAGAISASDAILTEAVAGSDEVPGSPQSRSFLFFFVLAVSSGAHPLHLRNPGTADPLRDFGRLVPSTQTIVLGGARPSQLTLPRGRMTDACVARTRPPSPEPAPGENTS